MLTWRLTWNLLLSSLWLAVISTMLGRGGQYGWPSHLATCCPSWDAELPGCFSSNACSCPQTWGRIANYKATKELEASRGWQKIDRQNILLHLCLLSWVRVPLCSSLSLLACCSFGSEGFELLHSICLSKYSCTSCIFSKVNSGLPTFFIWTARISERLSEVGIWYLVNWLHNVFHNVRPLWILTESVMLQAHTFLFKWTRHSLPVYEKGFQKTINRFFPVLSCSWEHSQLFLCWDVESCRKVKAGVFHAQHHKTELFSVSWNTSAAHLV